MIPLVSVMVGAQTLGTVHCKQLDGLVVFPPVVNQAIIWLTTTAIEGCEFLAFHLL